MTCAQGLLRLLWGGAEVGVLRDWVYSKTLVGFEFVVSRLPVKTMLPVRFRQKATPTHFHKQEIEKD